MLAIKFSDGNTFQGFDSRNISATYQRYSRNALSGVPFLGNRRSAIEKAYVICPAVTGHGLMMVLKYILISTFTSISFYRWHSTFRQSTDGFSNFQ